MEPPSSGAPLSLRSDLSLDKVSVGPIDLSRTQASSQDRSASSSRFYETRDVLFGSALLRADRPDGAVLPGFRPSGLLGESLVWGTSLGGASFKTSSSKKARETLSAEVQVRRLGEEEEVLARLPAGTFACASWGVDTGVVTARLEDERDVRVSAVLSEASSAKKLTLPPIKIGETRRKTSSSLGPLVAAKGEEVLVAALACGHRVSLWVSHKGSVKRWKTLELKHERGDEVECLSVLVCEGDATVLVAAGARSGRISLFRVRTVLAEGATVMSSVRTQLHWHAHRVTALALCDEFHLISGGTEGVLVSWRLEDSSKSFLPRLGSPVLCLQVATPLARSSDEMLAVLADGTALELETPTLFVKSRRRLLIPSSADLVLPKGDGFMAVTFAGFHRPGVADVVPIRADVAHTEEEEGEIDVLGRNPVSNSDPAKRWRIESLAFEGQILGAVSRSGESRRRELIVRKGDAQVFRAELETAQPPLDAPAEDRPCPLSVSANCAAVSVPGTGSLRLYSALAREGTAWGLERALDLRPCEVVSVALPDDESCVAALTSDGGATIWDREGKPLRSAFVGKDAFGCGLVATRHSREMFAFSSTGTILALMSGVRLTLETGVRGACAGREGAGVFLLDSGELIAWSGRPETAPKVLATGLAKTTRLLGWTGIPNDGYLVRDDVTKRVRVVASDLPEPTFVASKPRAEQRGEPERSEEAAARPEVAPAVGASRVSLASVWSSGVPSHALTELPRLTSMLSEVLPKRSVAATSGLLRGSGAGAAPPKRVKLERKAESASTSAPAELPMKDLEALFA